MREVYEEFRDEPSPLHHPKVRNAVKGIPKQCCQEVIGKQLLRAVESVD